MCNSEPEIIGSRYQLGGWILLASQVRSISTRCISISTSKSTSRPRIPILLLTLGLIISFTAPPSLAGNNDNKKYDTYSYKNPHDHRDKKGYRDKYGALDLEALTGDEAIKMMEAGTLTSVELTRAYLKRIEALNKRGPGLNAVSQLNPDALKEAAKADHERAMGIIRGPAHGLPILLKDLIDATPMYTSAGNYSLRNSFPPTDSGIVKKLRENGVVILGKLGLSEFANSFGRQPSGFGNLTGQVLNAVDADQNPSGSSSGTGTAIAASMSTLGIGTETSGSIISPSRNQGIVGLRPTVGLVQGYGIAPIIASQDTAGPMTRTVTETAMTLQSIVGPDPEGDALYTAIFGADYLETGLIPTPPEEIPDYMSALDLNFVAGKRIGYNGDLVDDDGEKTSVGIAYDALVAAGAIMVPDPVTSVGSLPAVPTGYEQHRMIDLYYERLGPTAPIQSLLEEVAKNLEETDQALKFGNVNHLNRSLVDVSPGGENETQFRTNLPLRKAAYHNAIDTMMNMGTPDDPSDDVIAVLGSVPSGAQAGYPQITLPMGYSASQRRTGSNYVYVHGSAYTERDMIGVAYVIEQATLLRQPPSEVNPSMYRCAKTIPAPAYAERGHCNPDYDTVMALVGKMPKLPFALETESIAGLQARMAMGSLTSETLTKAYLARIAYTNAEGPAVQAVRDINMNGVKEAKKLDKERAKKKGKVGPLYGIPVLLNDAIDAAGLPTTGGSIALQDLMPKKDSTIVAKLKKAGAIILGKTNVSELNGLFDANMPEGYSSLGGQVLLPSDTDDTPAGSSGGSAAATASGLAAMAIGVETSLDTAQLIAPAGVAGVVGLKPTVGLVSTKGVMPIATSQDAPGPITRTVYDAALALEVMAGGDYLDDLTPEALSGKRVAIIDDTDTPYVEAIATLAAIGATTEVVEIADTDLTGIVMMEFKRDLNAYLSEMHGYGPRSLQGIIDYNNANPVEGLKYQQNELLEAQAVDLTDPATMETYTTNLVAGKTAAQELIDTILSNGTPDDPSDDFDVIMVPRNDDLVDIADVAGYPVLTVPAGEGVEQEGRNPISVIFVSSANTEGKLLAAGYAFEQGSAYQRRAPSITNPSMYRCVPGSAFFTAELCHPGDRLYVYDFGPSYW